MERKTEKTTEKERDEEFDRLSARIYDLETNLKYNKALPKSMKRKFKAELASRTERIQELLAEYREECIIRLTKEFEEARKTKEQKIEDSSNG